MACCHATLPGLLAGQPTLDQVGPPPGAEDCNRYMYAYQAASLYLGQSFWLLACLTAYDQGRQQYNRVQRRVQLCLAVWQHFQGKGFCTSREQ